MNKVICHLGIIFGCYLLTACNGTNGNREGLVEAQFNVEQPLLSKYVYDNQALKFSVQPPINFTPIDSSLLSSLKKQVLSSDYNEVDFLSGTISTLDSSVMLILDISQMDINFFDQLQSTYTTSLNSENLWTDVQLQKFQHNCFEIHQYLLQNQNALNFKLVCFKQEENIKSPIAEIIYILRRSNLEKTIKSVESSIGSLNCIL